MLSLTLLFSAGNAFSLNAKSEENAYYQLQQQKETIVKRTVSRLAKEIAELLPVQKESHEKILTLLRSLDIVSEPSLAPHSVNTLLQIKIAEILSLQLGEVSEQVLYEELMKMAQDIQVVDSLTEELQLHSGNILLINKLDKKVHFDWITHIAGSNENSNIRISGSMGSNRGNLEPNNSLFLNSGLSFDPSSVVFGSKTVIAITPEGGKRFIFIIDTCANYIISANEAGDVIITPVA